MSINRKKLCALLGVVAIAIAVATTAGAARQGTPGVTATQITIGGTFPLTEPNPPNGASLYATIAYAEQAYYGYVNAPKNKGGLGGVNGRTIKDIVLDDQYEPSETFSQTKKLVENDHVFAVVGSLGTATNLATIGYLNDRKVPQVLLATGDAYWGLCALNGSAFKPIAHVCPKRRPWTEGWQPDYPGEGVLYGKYILAHGPANPKIGVLYQNDAYGQNYLAGLRKGLGSHKGDIVHTEAYASGESGASIGARVVQIAEHGANVFVIFATPGSSIAALVAESSIPSYHPLTILNNVSANRVFMLTAQAKGATVNNVITTTYIKSQTDPKFASDPAMALAKAIIYGTNSAALKHEYDIGDNNLIYGLASAWTFVDALKHAGKNPTRASLMHALRTINENGNNKNPFVYPGMAVKTSSSRLFPMQQLQFEKWSGQTNACDPTDGASCGDWKTFGGVLASGT